MIQYFPYLSSSKVQLAGLLYPSFLFGKKIYIYKYSMSMRVRLLYCCCLLEAQRILSCYFNAY